ncbi:MAG TPA: peptide deformylase [Alphaproteobacteria bacterium]|nr:peptide deformylase [Alphaproteobacteria bacterium]
MAPLTLITAPDPRLKLKSAPVEKVDARIRSLTDDMLKIMYAAPGIGLSAIQVGVLERVIVIDLAKDPDPPAPIRLINPEILVRSDERAVFQEGCLSFPEYFADVERANVVTVRYLDLDSEIRTLEAEGMLATCIQHEIDHLDGILFVDHISGLRRNIILRKLAKLKRLEAAST